MSLFNPARPDRPDHNEDGEPLLYRTMPKKQKVYPRFFSVPHVICAIRLYRACHQNLIPRQVAIGELHDYLFGEDDLISKRTMGNVVIHSVKYEPRKLRNVRHEDAQMTYNFNNMLDLQYGLEWQLCAVIYKWLDMNGDFPAKREEWQPRMQEELDLILISDDTEKFIVEDAAELQVLEPDWDEVLATYVERKPAWNHKPATFREKKPLRDFSKE